MSNENTQNRFDYLKRIAEIVGVKVGEEDYNILAERLKKVDINQESMLSAFLREKLQECKNQNKAIYFPFGFNESQKKATEMALNNSLSIIEGPPGTGKTQTILNIIANIVMRGESVAVVSSNNTATKNIREKLGEYKVDFICAFLGNSDNKNEFIKNQPQLPENISEWKLDDENIAKIKTEISSFAAQLDKMLKTQNELAKTRQTLDAFEVEYKHFKANFSDTDCSAKHFKNKTSENILKMLLRLEKCDEQTKIFLRFFEFAVFYFRYGLKFLFTKCYKLIAVLQNHFYKAKIAELTQEIETLEKDLNEFGFAEKMQEYSDLSMSIFKHELTTKYANKERTDFKIDELGHILNTEQFIREYPVVLSTTYSLTSSLSNDIMYDYVIVDESSQVDIVTGALAFSCAKKAVVVGDLKQLQPVVIQENIDETNKVFAEYHLPDYYLYDKSFLYAITKAFYDLPKTFLHEHYRCHPKIIDFCNRKFYDNQLVILSEIQSDEPLKIHKTEEGNHARKIKDSWSNERQVAEIQTIIPSISNSAGIITPYNAQENALQKEFGNIANIDIGTVHKFQGKEKDVVIFSSVLNQIKETSLSNNPNLLNVAISRAKKQFILVIHGNGEETNNNIADFVNYCNYNNVEIQQGTIRSVFDYLYKCKEEEREKLFKTLKYPKEIADCPSEILMHQVIKKVLGSDTRYNKFELAIHIPLRTILHDTQKLDNAEAKYALRGGTHIDFLIFDKFSKKPVLAIEVDGWSYHLDGTPQAERDKKKNSILAKYKIPLIRFKTEKSHDEARKVKEFLKEIEKKHRDIGIYPKRENTYTIKEQEIEEPKGKTPIEKELEKASKEKSSLKILFRDKKGNITERTISEIVIVGDGNINAYCHLRRRRRTFSISGILEISKLQKPPND